MPLSFQNNYRRDSVSRGQAMRRHIEVFRQQGSKSKERITDILPLMSDGGQVVTWTGLDVPAETRIEFDWNWDETGKCSV
jgi:hypothetical protein